MSLLRDVLEELRDPLEGWSGDAACVSAEVAARAADELEKLRMVLVLACPTPWVWFQMEHSDIPRIKETGQRILVFVPKKRERKGADGTKHQIHEAKLIISKWSTAVAPTDAVTPSKMSLELEQKHGGFWAADRRGIKPIRGVPSLWAYLPIIEGIE